MKWNELKEAEETPFVRETFKKLEKNVDWKYHSRMCEMYWVLLLYHTNEAKYLRDKL